MNTPLQWRSNWDIFTFGVSAITRPYTTGKVGFLLQRKEVKMRIAKVLNVLNICVVAAALSGCETVAVPYNQSQDDLRASSEKFGGREFLHMSMEQFLHNVFLTTRHCSEYPNYVVSPDKRSMTASVTVVGLTEPAYWVVIDADEKNGGVEISWWAQNENWKRDTAKWVEQMKNPEICKNK